MNKTLILFVLYMLPCIQLFAQFDISRAEREKIIRPSPTASSLGKYGEYPVSLYNGLVNIGQELLNIKSGSLSLDISLSYHAGGNRPADVPGWVGLGFSLNAGGVITRVARDLPDDVAGGFYHSITDIQSMLNGYMPTTTYLEHYIARLMDAKSDKYLFNFGGRAGEFVFDWNRNVRLTKVQPFKIEVNNTLYGFESFTITTEDGVVYTFSQPEWSKYTRYDNLPDLFRSAWYLTKIKNLSGDSIVLKYVTPPNNARLKFFETEKMIIGHLNGGPLFNESQKFTGNHADYVTYLDEIEFSGGKVSFVKSKRNDPYYVPSGAPTGSTEEKKLDAIVLYNSNGQQVRKWELGYIENTEERLKLQTLTLRDAANESDQQYQFEYNPTKLPAPTFDNPNPYNTNSVDYWGYYNLAGNLLSRIPITYSSYYAKFLGSADRTPNAERMKAEILTKITYPTGGYTEFEYSPNDYSDQGISFASNPMVEYTHIAYSFQYEDGFFDQDPATITFSLTEPTAVTVSRSIKVVGPNRAWMPSDTWETNVYSWGPGTYTLSSIFNTSELLNPSSSDIHFANGSVTFNATVPVHSKIGGGLRIQSIKNFDGLKVTTRSFEYKLEGSSVSSGYLSMFPVHFVPLEVLWQNTSGVFLSSDPINDVPEGAPVGYSRVAERFEDSSSIVHDFTTYLNYPDGINGFNNGFSEELIAHLTSMNMYRGREVSTAYFDSQGIIKKRVVNEQGTMDGVSSEITAIEIKPTFNFTFPDPSGNPHPNPIISVLSSQYNILTRFLYNKTTTEYLYANNGTSSIDIYKKTYYDNPLHLQPTRTETLKSDGSKIITYTSYPDDYASGTPFIDYMKTNHLIAFPIEQVTYRETAGGRTILSGTVSQYKSFGKGLVDKVFKLETASPIAQASFKFSNQPIGVMPFDQPFSSFSVDSRYKPVLTYDSYDSSGNPLQFTVENGSSYSYLWSYNGMYPVAEIVNARQADAAYTGFEADGKGNWDYSGIAATDVTAPAGNKCYDLSSGALVKGGLSYDKEYTLTYWAKSTAAGNVSGAPADAIDTKGDWTLYKRKLNYMTSVTLSGSVLVDEVRLHPSKATMTTYTYSPLIGVTSETDPAGKVTYYEYDGVQRLEQIKDQFRRIIKLHDYDLSNK